MPKSNNQTLAMIHGPGCAIYQKRLYVHISYGRVIEEFAKRYKHIVLAACHIPEKTDRNDYLLPENVSLVPLPNAPSALKGTLHMREFAKAYRKTISQADVVFVRGCLVPAISVIYNECARQNKQVCHWLVGNPVALLQSHKRIGVIKDKLALLASLWWEHLTKKGRQKSGGSLICNGAEIAQRFPSPNTHITVSTTLIPSDLRYREDTCLTNPINITCLCFIRPEKGIEYLLQAFSLLKINRTAILSLVGPRTEYQAYQKKLDSMVNQLNIQDKVFWRGHAEYKQIPDYLQKADIFVLPTLSEGTPRVLVEARANCVPVISTNVGGIPTSVTHNHDGILVNPKQSQELAHAIDKVIMNGELRRSLIRNGFEKAKTLTIDKFGDQVCKLLS